MTGEIKGAIKSRQKIYQKHGKTQKWKARNIVQWQIKQAKKKYYANKIQNLKSKAKTVVGLHQQWAWAI